MGSGGPQPRPPPEAAGPQTSQPPDVGGEGPQYLRGRGPRNSSPTISPVPLPLPLPLLLSIIQGACSRNSPTRVLVIYLDSAHPPCPASRPQGGG